MASVIIRSSFAIAIVLGVGGPPLNATAHDIRTIESTRITLEAARLHSIAYAKKLAKMAKNPPPVSTEYFSKDDLQMHV